jgi:two-component system sensor histidine kinase YesM
MRFARQESGGGTTRRLPGRKYFHRVLGLFLAAALLPVLVLSFTLTGIATAALLRAGEERGRAAAASFSAGYRGLVEGVDRSLALIAAAPETKAALANAGLSGEGADDGAAAGRLLALEASHGEGAAFALVSASGGTALGTRSLPPDWDPETYGDWGIFRKARASRASVFEARRRLTDKGETALVVAARAIRDGEGGIAGFALAEIDRPALVRAARAGGFGLTADFELLSPSGLVAFSLADSGREGFFEDELPLRGIAGARAAQPEEGGTFEEASAAGFLARAVLPSSLSEDLTGAMRRATLAGLAVCAILALVLALAASRIVTGPVLALSGAMRRLREGELSTRLEPSSEDELGDLVRSFNATAERLGELMAETLEDQELLRGAELRGLAARMNPHFLYNSLNSIRSLAKLGRNDEIVTIVSKLGKTLRAHAEASEGTSTVGAELELVRNYLDVEKVRFGERFAFALEVEEGILGCELPGLILEPLAENALTHGLERKSGPGRLEVSGGSLPGPAGKGRDILIAFEDDGAGEAPERLAGLSALLASGELPEIGPERGSGGPERSSGQGLGLAATNRRLRLRYGPGYGLKVSAGKGGAGFRVELRAPFIEGAV